MKCNPGYIYAVIWVISLSRRYFSVREGETFQTWRVRSTWLIKITILFSMVSTQYRIFTCCKALFTLFFEVNCLCCRVFITLLLLLCMSVACSARQKRVSLWRHLVLIVSIKLKQITHSCFEFLHFQILNQFYFKQYSAHESFHAFLFFGFSVKADRNLDEMLITVNNT